MISLFTERDIQSSKYSLCTHGSSHEIRTHAVWPSTLVLSVDPFNGVLEFQITRCVIGVFKIKKKRHHDTWIELMASEIATSFSPPPAFIAVCHILTMRIFFQKLSSSTSSFSNHHLSLSLLLLRLFFSMKNCSKIFFAFELLRSFFMCGGCWCW